MADEIFQKTNIGDKNLEYMGKCKNSRKKKRKDFYGNSKNIFAKSIFITANSTPTSSKTQFVLQASSVQLSDTTKTNIEATQTFDDDQTP